MLAACASEPSSTAALAQLLPKCQQLLHARDVAPHLLSRGTLTTREYEELGLGVGVQLYSQAAMAERLVMLLLKKPGGGAEQLLWALEKTLEGDSPQTSHRELADMLRKCSQQERDGEPERDNWVDLASSPPPWKSGEPTPLIRYDVRRAEKLCVTLVTESRRIKEDYSTFVYKTSELLLSKNIPVDKVQLALYSRLGIQSVDESLLSKVDEAKTIPSVIRAAMPFSSWYNYDLISHLVKLLVGAEGEVLVKNYEEKLANYFTRLVHDSPAFSSLDKFPDEFEELVVKLDWDFPKCTIQDITIFKEKLCKLLKQPDPGLFILKSIEEGCVEVTWVIPPVIRQEVCSAAESLQMKKETLQEYDIIEFRLGRQVNASTKDKSLTSDHHSHIPNMPGIVMEKRHKFQETKDDRDSAISIGSLSCDVPTHQLSATDLLLYPSQESVAAPTGSAVHVVEYLQKKMSETTTPPDSPLGESGIGMSFHFRAHQDVYKHVDTNTQTQ